MLYPACAGGEGPMAETFTRLALDPDLEVIEVGPIHDRAVRRDVAQIARAARVDLVSCGQMRILDEHLDLGAIDEGARQKALQALHAELDAAVELGAGTLTVVSGPDPGPGLRDQAVRQLSRSLHELCDRAAGGSVQILIEPQDRDMQCKALIGPTSDAMELYRQVGRSNFGLLIDHSHMALLGERPVKVLPAAREAVRHVHIGNCVLDKASRLYGDQHPPYGCRAGTYGTVQLAEFLRVLLDIAFFNTRQRPVMSFEIRPPSPQAAELVLAGAKRSLRTAWLEV
jgi:sugar phosphate isomerase/epimerase